MNLWRENRPWESPFAPGATAKDWTPFAPTIEAVPGSGTASIIFVGTAVQRYSGTAVQRYSGGAVFQRFNIAALRHHGKLTQLVPITRPAGQAPRIT